MPFQYTQPALDGFAMQASVSFAEPDWKGDADFLPPLEVADPDVWLADLAIDIERGTRQGWLTAYQSRRAAFDLQSIRCQVAAERRGESKVSAAILSRLDRLSQFVAAAQVSF